MPYGKIETKWDAFAGAEGSGLKNIREWFSRVGAVEPEVGRMVDEADASDVCAAFRIVLPCISAAELLNVLLLAFDGGWLRSTSRRVYFTLYVSLLAASVACFLFLHVHRGDVKTRPRLILNGQVVYVAFLCLWGTFVTLYDQHATENVSVYVTLVMAVAVLARFRPPQSICVLGISQLLLLIFFTRFQTQPVNNTGNYLNTTFMCVTAIAISCTRYGFRASEMRARLIMTRQNEEIERINARLRYLVDTDELTGLSNRRVLDGALPALYDRCRAEGRPFTTLMIDIDDFKAFNDTYGHQMGDRCIREVAEVLRRAVQEIGDRLVVRYGGEEFALFAADIDEARAARLAEEICAHVRGLCFEGREGMCYDAVRVSVGWHWGVPGEGTRVSEAISRADHALYEAKKGGKDRAVRG